MSLSDTAKNLQAQAVSTELRWLREMRAYTKKHTHAEINEQWGKIARFEESPESKTPEGYEKLCRMCAEANECHELAKFYQEVLNCAETAEHREKGGAEKEMRKYRKSIEARIAEIKETYKRESKLQVSLDDMKESEADGHNEKGNDPFAPADGE